jgi:hypothetical protein
VPGRPVLGPTNSRSARASSATGGASERPSATALAATAAPAVRPASGRQPCKAAFEAPGNGLPGRGTVVAGAAVLGSRSLLGSDPTLHALQAAHAYLAGVHGRDVFGLQQLPLRHVFTARGGRSAAAAEHAAYVESRRRPAAAAAAAAAGLEDGGGLAFEARPFQLDDSIDLITFLNIQEGIRIEEARDLQNRVCQQLAYIVADAADEALKAAVAAAAAAAAAAAERVPGRFKPLATGAAPPALPGSPRRPGAKDAVPLWPGLTSGRPGSPGVAAAAAAAAAATFDPLPFFRITSSLNVALFYTLRSWLLRDMQAYAAAVATYDSAVGRASLRPACGRPCPDVLSLVRTGAWVKLTCAHYHS